MVTQRKNTTIAWEQRKLKTIFNILDGDRGKNYPHENDFKSTGDTLFLDTGNVTRFGFSFQNKKYILKAKDQALRAGKLKINDFIITSRGTLGNVAFYDAATNCMYPSIRINSAMLILRPRQESTVEYSFGLTQLRGKTISEFLIHDHVGSAQPHITKRDFSEIEIAVPRNTIEQKNIGFVFDRVRHLIAANEGKQKIVFKFQRRFNQSILTE